MRRRQRADIPMDLEIRVDAALSAVDAAHADLDAAVTSGASLADRRQAHARLVAAYATADRLLRQAVGFAKTASSTTRPGSFVTWSRWRSRLSRLDAARQAEMLAQQDDFGVLPPASVRAVDTGMLGPHIGELAYGRSKPPGSPAVIGLDIAAALDAATAAPARPAAPRVTEPQPATVAEVEPATAPEPAPVAA